MHIRLTTFGNSKKRILVPVDGTVFSEVSNYTENYTLVETGREQYQVYESLEMIQCLIADGEARVDTLKRLEREIARCRSVMTISQKCRIFGEQVCAVCDDTECGDNLAAKTLAPHAGE